MELKLLRKIEEWDYVGLLIVPYGIETLQPLQPTFVPVAFNRTLWN